MKKTLAAITAVVFAIVVAMSSFAVFATDSTACEISEIRMSVSIPNDMLFVTRESKETDSYFAKFKLDYDTTMKNFEKGNIYLQAMKEDGSVTMTVTAVENDASREIYNYSTIGDEKLSDIKAEYLSNKDKLYKSGSVLEYNGITYIYLVETGDIGCDYNTVFGGMDYHIHFGVKEGSKVTKDDKVLFESIIGGTNIIEDNFVNNNHDLLLYGGVTIAGIIFVAVIVVIVLRIMKKKPKRKHSHLVHELAHEHKITETTKIPRKRIEDITEPTMTFLKNYEPVEEKSAAKKSETAVPSKHDTAEYISVRPEKAARTETVSDNTDEINAIAAEARRAAAAERARRMEHEAVELPKPVREEIEEPEQSAPATAQSADSSFENAGDYFDEIPDSSNLFAAEIELPETKQAEEAPAAEKPAQEKPVETKNTEAPAQEENVEESQPEPEHYDVEDEDFDSEYYEEEEVYESHAAENAKIVFGAIGAGLAKFFKALGRGLVKFFKALGRGIVSVAGTIWTIIIYIVVHCKYFCINLSRAIKRKRNIKKRKKADEQRRAQAEQQHRDELAQRRAQRDAARARQRANASRGANDLVKVHSMDERRPSGRSSQRPSDRTAYPRNRKR